MQQGPDFKASAYLMILASCCLLLPLGTALLLQRHSCSQTGCLYPRFSRQGKPLGQKGLVHSDRAILIKMPAAVVKGTL